MGQIAAGFTRSCPQVLLEITAEDRNIDLVKDGYDIAIQVNPKPDETLVGRCFARNEMLLSSSQALTRPTAQKGDKMNSVPAIVYANSYDGGLWQYIAGAGAGLLPKSLIASAISKRELIVWGGMVDRPVELWVLHNSRRLVSTKISVFVEYLCNMFPTRLLENFCLDEHQAEE